VQSKGAAESALSKAQDILSGGARQFASNTDAALGNYVNAANRSIGNIGQAAGRIGGLSGLLSSMGLDIAGQGVDLSRQASPYVGQGAALANLDSSAGGLAGLYVQALMELDPDLQAALAGARVSDQYAVQRGAMFRDAGRMGVNPNSGRFAGLAQKLALAEAADRSGAMTETRLNAQRDRLNALRGAVSDAQSLGSTGAGITARGIDAQRAGAGLQQTAAGLLVSQAGLNAQQAGIAGQTERAVAANEAAKQSVQRAVAEQQNAIASYYAGLFDQFAQIAPGIFD